MPIRHSWDADTQARSRVVVRHTNRKQQICWNRAAVQPFFDVRTAVLNNTLEDAFRHRLPGFWLANDDRKAVTAAA